MSDGMFYAVSALIVAVFMIAVLAPRRPPRHDRSRSRWHTKPPS